MGFAPQETVDFSPPHLTHLQLLTMLCTRELNFLQFVMKNLIFTACLLNLLGTLAFPPTGLVAAELNATVSGPAPIPSGQVSVSTQDSARLPYGAAEVVKLSRAQVSEDVIISYVQNSGSTYSLSSDDI